MIGASIFGWFVTATSPSGPFLSTAAYVSEVPRNGRGLSGPYAEGLPFWGWKNSARIHNKVAFAALSPPIIKR